MAGSSASGHMPNVEARKAPVSLVTESESNDQATGDDTLSQAILRILERVVGTNTSVGLFGVAPNVDKYWLQATERIMDDLDPTSEQKLKGIVSLLRDEAYQWWLTVREGTQAKRLTWDFFKSTFQGKYVGASYVDARRKEFLSLTQGNKTVAEYEAEFLRLSFYARGIVTTKYERCAKIAEDVKHSERQNRENDTGRFRRDLEPSSTSGRLKKKVGFDGPVRAGVTIARLQPCADCGRHHLDVGLGSIKLRIVLRGLLRYKLQVKVLFSQGVGNSEARQLALVYTAHRREDGDAPDVIIGTFLIHKVPYTALIDIGSTHSYIACTMSGTLGIICESTVNKTTMLSPLGQSVRVNGVIFLADLMELPFGDFDLILGMD
ncbi:uncharacterized protein [Gossypium hirsutum]|uniref:Retrotransposon gag domain-containing protein n=1 Tax=Gossypium hirsutum TaxID=3635 RepID=A0A1U8ITA4_GOSHI|nr:uncharacterized protein LOC107900104 [Gossypium hirsutum]